MSAMKRVVSLVLSVCSSMALAQVTSTDLVEKTREIEGREIVFTGEVVGEAMRRGDHVWINVNDGASAIGVWAKRETVSSIGSFGSYRHRGDRVAVRGVFARSCPQHGGDMDIHAATVSLVEAGMPITHRVDVRRVIIGVGLLCTSLAAYLVWRRRKKALSVP